MPKVLGSPLAKLLALIAVFLVLPGCQPRPKVDGMGSPGVIDCGTKAVTDHAIDALPGVNRCLSAETDVQACLFGLIDPAVGIVLSTVACVTGHEGNAARSAAASNPFNDRDKRRAQRAAEFLGKLEERGYTLRN
jgi:hypothetical protein